MQFGNELDANLAIVEELLQLVPPEQRRDAKKAAVMIENTIERLKRDNPKNTAVMLGTVYAIFKYAEQIVKAPKGSDKNGGDNVIQLLER
jgi:hypothetical protein